MIPERRINMTSGTGNKERGSFEIGAAGLLCPLCGGPVFYVDQTPDGSEEYIVAHYLMYWNLASIVTGRLAGIAFLSL